MPDTLTNIDPVPDSFKLPNSDEKPHARKKIWVGSILCLVLFTLGIVTFVGTRPQVSSTNSSIGILQNTSVSPTPLPFAELTIPYLRSKQYQSVLGPREQVLSNANYTSYLASYSSEGLKINGLLTIPTGVMPTGGWPAIIFLHGYIPPTLYQTQSQYADYVDYLARNGFVVFKIDLRGHTDSEGEAGGGYFGSDYVTDTLSAYEALSKTDFVNPAKIGLWGHSMAGNIVMRSLAAKPDIPAGVIWAGAVYTYVDMQKYGIDDNSYRPPSSNVQRQNRRRELFEKHGSPSAESVFWQQVAPTNFLRDLKGAVQLNHAVNDDVVNIGYSRDLNELLDKTSVPHELNEYPSGGHNLTGTTFNQAMEKTVGFFRTHLQ